MTLTEYDKMEEVEAGVLLMKGNEFLTYEVKDQPEHVIMRHAFIESSEEQEQRQRSTNRKFQFLKKRGIPVAYQRMLTDGFLAKKSKALGQSINAFRSVGENNYVTMQSVTGLGLKSISEDVLLRKIAAQTFAQLELLFFRKPYKVEWVSLSFGRVPSGGILVTNFNYHCAQNYGIGY